MRQIEIDWFDAPAILVEDHALMPSPAILSTGERASIRVPLRFLPHGSLAQNILATRMLGKPGPA